MAGKRPACYPLIERRRDGNWHGGFALFGAGSRKRPQMKQHSVHGEVEVAMPTTRQHGEKITVAIDGELLECGVCCGPLTSELFQCTQGHISCSQRCTNEAPHGELECLMCRGEEPATRCRAMERVIAGVSTPCPFLQHGCTDMVPYTEKHSHEASCAHAPCLCPIAGCAGRAGRAGVKSLRDHLMADHEEVTLTRVRPGRLTPVKLRACVENGGAACIIGSGAAEFLLAVGHGHGVPAGRTLSLLHLKDASQLVLDDGEEFMYRIEVVGESAVLSLSGQAEGVVRLRRPYQAREFLFVPDAMWGSCSGEVSVLIELKRSEDSV